MAMYEIISNKNVSEIVSSLRSKGYQLDMIPSDISGGVRSSFSAVLHGGGGGMLGSRNEPGVKVVIYDSGDKRRVELEALSTSPMGQKFNLKKGEQLCDQLYAELNEGSPVSEPQVEEPAPAPAPMPASEPASAPDANDMTAKPKKDDFASKFMKGFKEINPAAPSEPAVPEPAPVSVAGSESGFKEMPKPDYVKPSISADEYSAPSVGDATWRCEKCGKVNIGDSKFCGDCGTPRPDKTAASAGAASGGTGGAGGAPTPKPQPKPVNKTVIIIAAVTVLVLAVGIPILSRLSSTPSYDDEYYGDDYDDGYYDESYDDSEMSDDGYYDEDYPNNGNDSYFVIGNTYQIQTNLRVREGPGKEYRILSRDELVGDDYANSVDSKTTTDALMEKGKYVTCLGMEGDWMRIESGWICVYDEGEDLVR